jgi:hypothetical protein
MCTGLALLAVGCRNGTGQTEARARPPASLNPADRFRVDTPIPFTPTPGEVAPAQPCGAKSKGPCLLLGWEQYNWAWGYTHAAWFMDTDGREYEFSYHPAPRRGSRPEDSDPVRLAMNAHLVITSDDFAKIVAASKPLPRRVTTAEVTHALSLIAASQTGTVETIRDMACYDAGGSALSGYVFATARGGSPPVLLEEEQCFFLLKGNDSRAARELAQWVHRLRGTPSPFREPK